MAGGRAFYIRKSPADDKRRCPWLEPPPATIFTGHIPPPLQTQTWNNSRRRSPTITKSRPPTTTRCNNAHQRLQLVHVITENPSHNPTLNSDRDRPRQFLDDSAINAQTMHELKNESYWCVLRVGSTPKTTHQPPPSPPICYYRFDGVREPRMNYTGLESPNIPTSGLVVNYRVLGQNGRDTCTKYVSIRHQCSTVDPFDSKKKLIVFTPSVVYYQGKYYAMSLQGTLVVMEVIDHRLKITGMSAIRAIPSSNWRFFGEYMFDTSNGEILLVFLIYEKSLATTDRVEVFRLDFVTLGWIKVKRLRGKTMFLKGEYIWVVDSAEFGCSDDCVYFEQKLDGFWRVYDMKNDTISTV